MMVGDRFISDSVADFITAWAYIDKQEVFDWLYPPEDRLFSWSQEISNALVYSDRAANEHLPVVCCNCLNRVGTVIGGGLKPFCPSCYKAPDSGIRSPNSWRYSALNQLSHYSAPVVVVTRLLELGIIK